jgi:ribA/ribD-fused uncharacterized protein
MSAISKLVVKCGQPSNTITRPTKLPIEKIREAIRKAPYAAKAKAMGRWCPLRKDWESVKIGIMYKALYHKFRIPKLMRKLLRTGNKVLKEDSPTDSFWGCQGDGGLNMLGRLIMMVRDTL